MARDRLSYRQRDLTAAIRALKAAGEQVARIEVHKGGVTIIPGEPGPAEEIDLEAETRAMEEDLRRHAEANRAKAPKVR